MMPVTYEFKDSKMSDSVSKSLMFMSKFSRKQAIIRFSDTSVSIVWSIPTKSMYIHNEITAPDMFKNKLKLRPLKLSDSIVEVDPSILGRTMKGSSQCKSVTISISKPDKIVIIVGSDDSSKRKIFHTIQCIFKTQEDYTSILLSEIERMSGLKYDIKCFVRNIQRLKHIVETFQRLQSPKFWIWARKVVNVCELTIQARSQGSNIRISIGDLEDGFADGDIDFNVDGQKTEAGVNVETKNVALFLSNIPSKDRSRICFSIKHINTLKITLVTESMPGEKSYQSLLLPHGV